ncbi:hypothetical protein SDC9_64990 [bioreactor metagenome]|uniref:Uncharacterized protein n=1 Tax=bioreactor metagenome TaxID=1076179 RepID=A0A644XRP1_9ZZZZ
MLNAQRPSKLFLQRFRSNFAVEFFHLRNTASINAIQDRVAQRLAVFIHRCNSGHDRADSNCLNLIGCRAAFAQQGFYDFAQIADPVLNGVMFSKARLW